MLKKIKYKGKTIEIEISNKGILICCTILFLWCMNLAFGLSLPIAQNIGLAFLLILIQTHLYTGLFISAHDAMHGTLSPNQSANKLLGRICTFLYAFFGYSNLYIQHHKHHQFVGNAEDPDYYEGNFFSWYFQFLKHYISLKQIVLYAISFNILKLFLPTENLLLFWILPAITSTFQLFYFGTYLPHKKEHHHKKHKSDSFKKNHFLAFISCYFFGYHFEHHEFPHVPWWQLYKVKNLS